MLRQTVYPESFAIKNSSSSTKVKVVISGMESEPTLDVLNVYEKRQNVSQMSTIPQRVPSFYSTQTMSEEEYEVRKKQFQNRFREVGGGGGCGGCGGSGGCGSDNGIVAEQFKKDLTNVEGLDTEYQKKHNGSANTLQSRRSVFLKKYSWPFGKGFNNEKGPVLHRDHEREVFTKEHEENSKEKSQESKFLYTLDGLPKNNTIAVFDKKNLQGSLLGLQQQQQLLMLLRILRPLTGNPGLENIGFQVNLNQNNYNHNYNHNHNNNNSYNYKYITAPKYGTVFGKSKQLHVQQMSLPHLQLQRITNDIYRRCVVLSNINETMSISAILQQVCGGPLEKIVRLPGNKIELHFIFPLQAKLFHNFGRKNSLFKVNGISLNVAWSDREFCGDAETGVEERLVRGVVGVESQRLDCGEEATHGLECNLYRSTQNGLKPELSPSSAAANMALGHFTLPKWLSHEIVMNGCRRCLIISQVVAGKKLRTSDKMFYPEPEVHYSQDLHIYNLRRDFKQFGEIVDIGSVISRKLSFSVFYWDIRSAIKAKTEFERTGSSLNLKYKDWNIWYGKDITDRACFVL